MLLLPVSIQRNFIIIPEAIKILLYRLAGKTYKFTNACIQILFKTCHESYNRQKKKKSILTEKSISSIRLSFLVRMKVLYYGVIFSNNKRDV